MITQTEKDFVIKTTINLPKKRIQNIMVGLWENGYSPWLRKVLKWQLAEGLTREDFKEGGFLATSDYYPSYQIVSFTEGCSLVLSVDNPENDEEKFFTLNLESIAKGLQLMAEKCPHHFQDIVDENDDANTSDILGQYIVYGEIIYG